MYNDESLLELSERKKKILAAIIDSYVLYGEPVSSRTLCDLKDFTFSSATIRSEMAELTAIGFLEQPHTSAGRVPSDLGYRFYINNIMNRKTVSKKEKEIIYQKLSLNSDSPENLIQTACEILADITNFLVVSTGLYSPEDTIKQIQIFKTGNANFLIVLSTNNGTIKNRISRLQVSVSGSIIKFLEKTLNDYLCGLKVNSIKLALMQEISSKLGEVAVFISPILLSILEIAKEINKKEISLEGETNLLFLQEFMQDSVCSVAEFLKRKQNLVPLIFSNSVNLNSQPNNQNKTDILVGKETDRHELNNFSVLITQYNVAGQNFGTFGIIGPTRMDYGCSVAKLEYIASSVEEILNNLLDLE